MAEAATRPYNLQSRDEFVELPVHLHLSDDNRFMLDLLASNRTHINSHPLPSHLKQVVVSRFFLGDAMLMHRDIFTLVILIFRRKSNQKQSNVKISTKVLAHTIRVMILGVLHITRFTVPVCRMAKLFHTLGLNVKINSKRLPDQKTSNRGCYLGKVEVALSWFPRYRSVTQFKSYAQALKASITVPKFSNTVDNKTFNNKVNQKHSDKKKFPPFLESALI